MLWLQDYSNPLVNTLSDATEKFAVPLAAKCNEIVHCGLLPQMLKSPAQPENTLPAFAVAFSVTLDAAGKANVQTAPQSMPAGSLLTMPRPLPPRLTVRGSCCRRKVTVMSSVLFTLSAHTGLDAQTAASPDHVSNSNPLPRIAAASNVMVDPVAKLAVQVVPQSMPAGVLKTRPVPIR